VIAQDHRGPPSTRQHTRPALIVQLLYYTLWGDPTALLEAILSVVPVEPDGASA